MKKISSKVAGVSVPAATVAVPVASVVVLSVNETPAESIKLLDATKQKLKVVELGEEIFKTGKPTVAETELKPTSAPPQA